MPIATRTITIDVTTRSLPTDRTVLLDRRAPSLRRSLVGALDGVGL